MSAALRSALMSDRRLASVLWSPSLKDSRAMCLMQCQDNLTGIQMNKVAEQFRAGYGSV
ncbi:hypothetical protein KIN20_002488 [Parelaphostrongylus tenuis]|uniref:Uncharacterized protein n=1 Tax=Parelaphostrongylus tenuis TaxID=148309 RepID=A0AAD5MEA0_PARTN|nr:hypothetical protein KIN20_002488 [Parelaphostrongylus tenuis]